MAKKQLRRTVTAQGEAAAKLGRLMNARIRATRPSRLRLRAFLRGFASAFDITGGAVELPPEPPLRSEADAIRSDWARVLGHPSQDADYSDVT